MWEGTSASGLRVCNPGGTDIAGVVQSSKEMKSPERARRKLESSFCVFAGGAQWDGAARIERWQIFCVCVCQCACLPPKMMRSRTESLTLAFEEVEYECVSWVREKKVHFFSPMQYNNCSPLAHKTRKAPNISLTSDFKSLCVYVSI